MTTPKIVNTLNALLASELGRNPYGEPVFRWAWSEDLLWPETPTGKMTTKPVEIPIIGGGTETHQMLVPEYKRRRMSFKLQNQWVVTRWLSPEMLCGASVDYKIGSPPSGFSHEELTRRWRAIFPGSDLPVKGLYINTDWANKPNLPPTLQDTQILIAQLREQLSGMSASARLADMLADDDEDRVRKRKITENICEDSFTAMMNPFPGSRSSFVSFPSTEKQVILPPTGAWNKDHLQIQHKENS